MATRQPEPSHRRHNQPSAQEEQPEMQSTASASRTRSRSQSSNDSQTVVLSHNDAKPSHSPSPAPQVNGEVPAEENLHCWICLVDEPMTEREAGEWRSPCSCNLTAHEDCLFQWIASQKEERVYCPQCKTEIQVAEPRDFIVDLTTRARRLADSCAIPAGLLMVSGITYSGLVVYGANAVALVFGANDAGRMFSPYAGTRGSLFLRTFDDIKLIAFPFLPDIKDLDWKYWIALPLIAPTLILSRFQVADDAYHFLPIIYCIFEIASKHGKTPAEMLHWPPSPGFTLATLPYIRTAYIEGYKYFFKDLEKKWERAVQRSPREGETAEEIARAADAPDDDDDQHGIELGIELIAEEEERGGNRRRDLPLGHLPAEQARQRDQAVADLERQHVINPEDAANLRAGRLPDQMPVPADNWERRLNFRSDGAASSVIGALFFPAISFVMGSIIKYTLPKTWIKPPYTIGWRSTRLSWSEGFLQSQFGRSVAGGCLFVVLKDAVLLYYKWKKAKDFSKRKILNYQGKKPWYDVMN